VNLVTGATGLLGSHVLIELCRKGQQTRALFRDEQKKQQVFDLFTYYFNDEAIVKWKLIEWQAADLLDITAIDQATKNIHTIYHCAAKVSFFKADFEACIQHNRHVTAHLVDFALKHGVALFCHVSSTAAIGASGSSIVTEESKWDVTTKHSGYGISKYLAEKEVWRGVEEGLQAVVVNPCVILGPAIDSSPSMQLIRTAKNGLRFYPSGTNSVVDVRDVALAMVSLCASSIRNERFLVVGAQLSFKDLMSQLSSAFHQKAPHLKAPRKLTLLLGMLNELKGHITGHRSGLSIETARSAYQSMQYSTNKIETALSFQFRPLSDTIENVLNGSDFLTK
jgi:nucleoside-diphosphate-sugar epimerase